MSRIRRGWKRLRRERAAVADAPPLRSELFSTEQLERHLRELAGWYELTERADAYALLRRLRDNADVLRDAHEHVREGIAAGERIAPAAEWLLDNYYLIDEQVRTSRRHLPRGYSRRLPLLANGPHRGLPRVYAIVTELISHTDGQVDLENLGRGVAAYQQGGDLGLGELWAIPIMLRLALIENLRRVAVRICDSHRECNAASRWFGRMVAEKTPTDLVMAVADMVRDRPNLSAAFVAEFARRVEGQSPSLSLATVWIEQRLDESHRTIEQMVHEEHQDQASDQVSIGNSINSLRTLGAIDWRDFVEGMSRVEATLRGDPAEVYANMDFATRDRYRHAIEELSRRSRKREDTVAREAIAMAAEAPTATPDGASNEALRRHVGFFLIDAGRVELSRRVGAPPTLGMLLAARGLWLRLCLYLVPMGLLVAGSVAVLLALTLSTGWHARDPWLPLWSALLGGALLIAVAQSAMACVNWVVTRLVRPDVLPRMEFRGGIPADRSTLVVVPAMIRNLADVDALTEGLEVHYLGNPDEQLHFGLLTDFTDAPFEVMPGDADLLSHAVAAVEALNEKYRAVRPETFYLFHRPRRWNEREGLWMGEERKRGKLSELNRLLRHGEREPFMRIAGNVSRLADVVCVITLDTDTQLPRDEARKLVGTMAHPLNRPLFDAVARRVIAGYGVLQPRAAISLPSKSRSWFARIFANDAGLDPYTRAVSDVYQDVFGEGSFIGKGIYDLRAFEAATGGCFPDNTILSHDLIEGCYARSGLVSDALVVEDQPMRYLADVDRRQRWMRGDWQILWWLLPWVPTKAVADVASGSRPTGSGARTRWVVNPLSALARWKILDNLRRSLLPGAQLALLLGGWTVLPGPAWCWTALVLGLLLVPAALSASAGLLSWPAETPLVVHLREWAWDCARQLGAASLAAVLLPYEAFVASRAASRSLWRVFVSHRRLLEWRTSSDSGPAAPATLSGVLRVMWFPAVLALGVAGVVLGLRPEAASASLPVALLWLLSPVLAWWLSRPFGDPSPSLSESERAFLGVLSRKTWRFFETFVTAEDRWLPPDNFQEYALGAVAHRTSPTNIGLALLGNLAARDFGYLTLGELLERCEQTTATLLVMDRHRGHFFNWYDTRTLAPLEPRYVSTVDSGNLAGHVMVLRSGLAELAQLGLRPRRMLAGLRHTVACLRESVGVGAPATTELARLLDALDHASANQPATMSAAHAELVRLSSLAEAVAGLQAAGAAEPRWWSAALLRECRAHRDELGALAPWCTLPLGPSWRAQTPAQQGALDGLRSALDRLDDGTNLDELAELGRALVPLLDQTLAPLGPDCVGCTPTVEALVDLRRRVELARARACELRARAEQLRRSCAELADPDLSFLYDASRKLFAIGFSVADNRLDRSYYDLLASEARLGSFVAIAQGRIAQDHWFALGRQLVRSGSSTALLSWSGSMFEYLMAQLVMPSYEESLLDATNRAVVRRQIAYGRQRGVPWGVSESGYNYTDADLNYQYRAFGVPGLGVKRGLGDDLVIAPYASALALMVEPAAACANLRRLSAEGHSGVYGMYEAVDYTPRRLPQGATTQTVRSYMAHHQGMSLLAVAHVLLDRPMQRRFVADPQLKATLLLLQERALRTAVVVQPHASEATEPMRFLVENETAMRVFTEPTAALPEVHLLSNGRYHVVVGVAGGGYSRWRELAVNRWREDATVEAFGMFCYLRDVDRGEVWSNTFQPALRGSDSYEAIFTQARAEFRRRDHDIDVHTQISVSPEDDIELRRITLTNRSRVARVIELSSYTEVVNGPQASDVAHRAFSNLFVQTALDPEHHAILCTRRPRGADERPAWMIHLMSLSGTEVGEASYETDRLRFIGRGRSVARPIALVEQGALSGTQGAVLDPVAAIRRSVLLQPDEEVSVDLVFGMADTREAAEVLVRKYHDQRICERVFGLSWTHSQVVLRQISASESEAQLYGRLAGAIVRPLAARRAAAAVLASNRRSQPALWAYGISGDLPIVLVRIAAAERLDLVRELLAAHLYWRVKGLAVDLVIWNEDHSPYRQALQDQIGGLIASRREAGLLDRPGGIFVRRSEQMADDDRIMLKTVARLVVSDGDGTLAQFAERSARPFALPPALVPGRAPRASSTAQTPAPTGLVCGNGLGGFTPDGREYIMTFDEGRTTPMPWVNVLANPGFGSVVTESGGAYTWVGNSHEYRLTTWHNDPVSDASGEAFYLRDEESGAYWSPTPLPARGAGRYVVRHGFGYCAFLHEEEGLACEMMVYVASDAPVKVVSLKVRNRSRRPRRVSLTGYWEWVLGEQRQTTAMHVVTEIDRPSGALTARNAYNAESGALIAFVDVSDRSRTVTGDRGEFLGRNGTFAAPAAMGRQRLSGNVGAGLDPCAALQVAFELAQDEVREIVFVIGAAEGIERVRELAQRFRTLEGARAALEKVWAHWNQLLGAVRVETPDLAVDLLANGWLLYQTIACRLWARTGYCQSSGAFGFRDQLQDAMALVHVAPWLLREHLLRAAAHQFREGDVQHWWHPPKGQGVRTHFSDDYLWLPCAVARYCEVTHDTGVLDEAVVFIEGRAVPPAEEAYYDTPLKGATGTLYEHCQRAIENGLRWGAHGLPLMGCGDWNDSMNRVGAGGQGESVWLAFFLHDVLLKFARVARSRGDEPFAERCEQEAGGLQQRIEAGAWDGAWYRRAYFDDGTPLGSASNAECQLDSVSQSWAVLSGAADEGRARMAMDQVDQRLIDRAARTMGLFAPPFDLSALEPGYVKGYPPGVRENGGQYTHAVVWAAMAFAQLGDTKRAWELWSILNPVARSSSPTDLDTYRVEPYVAAADVYTAPPHVGRGGWSWYTGSAGWMYRLLTESLLGLRLEPGRLYLTPRLPAAWPGFTLHYRFRDTLYHLRVTRSAEASGRIVLDGVQQTEPWVPVVDDRRDHEVQLEV